MDCNSSSDNCSFKLTTRLRTMWSRVATIIRTRRSGKTDEFHLVQASGSAWESPLRSQVRESSRSKYAMIARREPALFPGGPVRFGAAQIRQKGCGAVSANVRSS